MFFHKTTSQLNNHNMEPGETLFQYLKRKKHIELKHSLTNSITNSLTNSIHKNTLTPKQPITISQPQIPPKSTENKQSARQASTKRKGKKSSNKKKKTDQNIDNQKQNHSELSNLCHDIFKDQKTTRVSLANTATHIFEHNPEPIVKKIPTRSFMSMISPLKNQISLQHSPFSRAQSLNNTHQRKSSKKIAEFNSKKMIKQAMTKVQRYCHEQIDFEKEIKQKIKFFFSMLNSILIRIEDSGEKWVSDGMEKKMKQVRSSMKLINGYVSRRQGKEKQDIAELIEEMYVSLNQVLDTFEGQVKSQNQSNSQSIILRKQQEFEQKIEELTKQRKSLSRQINGTNKEYNKLEREYDQLLQKYNSLQDQRVQKGQQSKHQETKRFEYLEQEIETLCEENVQLTNKIILLEKKLKDSEYKFEDYSRRVHLQHQEKLSERQNYLLKQICLLKAECAKDITNLNNFYTNRQQHYPKKIKELEKIIQNQLSTIENLQYALKDTEKITKLQESNVKESKRKLDQVMADLYRINEELYKHWIVLKDIKTLLTRLNMFDKFERIFKDIPFDDLLFLP